MPSGACRACRRDLAVGMKRLLATHRGEDDRRLPGGAEQLGRDVDLADVHEPAGPDLKPGEPFAVRPQGCVVIHPRRHVSEMGRGQLLPRDQLEVENIQGFVR